MVRLVAAKFSGESFSFPWTYADYHHILPTVEQVARLYP